MSLKDTAKPSNTDRKKEISTEQIALSEEEILETLKEAHKTISAQKDDFLKRKISQNIEHKLASLKANKDSSKILPERILGK